MANKYGEVYAYIIHKSDNVRPILEALFAVGFEWTGGGQDLKHFDCHLVITEMTDGSRYVSITGDFDKSVNHFKRTPLNSYAFAKWYCKTFNQDLPSNQMDYVVLEKVLFESVTCEPTNAMYPIEVVWQSQKYHFKSTNEIKSYFENELGYEVK